MGTNCAPLLADLFLHSYEYEFIIKKLKTDISVALRFNKTFRYIDDLLSINNCDFVSEIYPLELELKNTTVCQTETSYLNTKINIEKGRNKDQHLRQERRLQLQDSELSVS